MAKGSMRHERRESIGDEAAEHSCPIGTGTGDREVKNFVFGRSDCGCGPKKKSR